MQIARSVATIAVVLILIGIITLPVMSVLSTQIIIPSLGSISYVPTPPIRPLHVEGRYIKDDSGNVVILRGVNAGGFADTCTGWKTTTWSDSNVRANLQAMQSWGLNCIRIMGTIRWWLENCKEVYYSGEDICSQTFRDSIIRTIELAEEYDIYVIFTFWSIDTVGSRSPGAQDYLPYPPTASTQNYQTIRDSDDFVQLWGGDSATSAFLARFANVNSPVTSVHVHNNGVSPPSVSEALQDFPNVVYELYNEPAGAVAGWADVAQRCVDAIRARGDNHPVLVQSGYCGSFYAWFDTVYSRMSTRSNIIYSNHIYRSGGSFPGNPYLYDDVKRVMMTDTNPNTGFGCGYVLSKNVPILIGEFGASGSGEELTCMESILRVMNENGMSWAAWLWETGGGFSLISGTNFTPTQSGQLVKTYASS